jgi:hypothetical protein
VTTTYLWNILTAFLPIPNFNRNLTDRFLKLVLNLSFLNFFSIHIFCIWSLDVNYSCPKRENILFFLLLMHLCTVLWKSRLTQRKLKKLQNKSLALKLTKKMFCSFLWYSLCWKEMLTNNWVANIVSAYTYTEVQSS